LSKYHFCGILYFMPSSPYLIRGHHLNTYANLASWRADPRSLAESLIERRLYDAKRGGGAATYSQDVIGTTREQARLVAARFQGVFSEFMGLDSEHVVIITNGAKDHICQSCIIGKHCEDRGIELAIDTEDGVVGVYGHDLDDMFAISSFKKLAKRLDAEGIISSGLGQVQALPVALQEPSQDALPILESNMIAYEPSLKAPAGYVRAVLSHWTLAHTLKY
jgi:hypothetical protein